MLKKSKVSSTIKQDDFKSVARRLECDEDKARFEAKLGRIAKVKANSPRAKRPHGKTNP